MVQLSNPFSSSKFEITYGQFGWQAVAIDDIAENETIVKIERKNQINVDHVVKKFREYDIKPTVKFDCIESLGTW